MGWEYIALPDGTVEWTEVLNKPTTFTPTDHNHDYADIVDPPTIPTVRRVETFLGTTDASGNYTIVYSTAFPTVPDVQPVIQAGTVDQSVRVTSSSTTGFTVQVTQRNSVNILGSDVLLSTTSVVNGASVSILVTARE